jgi:hypothetical protein
MLNKSTGTQFLRLPWNIESASSRGQGKAHGVPISALETIEISSYVSLEEGIDEHDLTLRFNNGVQPIRSKGNGVEVVQAIHENKIGGLTHAFVQVTVYERLLCETGLAIGWNAPKNSKIISATDFLFNSSV